MLNEFKSVVRKIQIRPFYIGGSLPQTSDSKSGSGVCWPPCHGGLRLLSLSEAVLGFK
jgi:hypothetical protein